MSRVRARSPILFLVIACALWGGATVLSKHLLASVPPVELLALQLAASTIALWLIVAAVPSRAFDQRALVPLILHGLLNPGLSYTLSLFGLAEIPAGVATLLWAAEPIMILGLAGIVLGEPVTVRLLALMAIGAFGVLLVAGAFGSSEMEISFGGILLMLGAVLCCAAYTVFSRRVAASTDPLLTVSIQQTAGLVWALCLLPLEVRFSAFPISVSLSTIATAALSGLLYYAAAYWLYLAALKSVPAAVAGSFFNMIPVVGVALAFVFLGESLTPIQITGALVIMASMILLVRWTAPQEIAPADQTNRPDGRSHASFPKVKADRGS
jgi:drug/metabolite transporter (DMT)-like permease